MKKVRFWRMRRRTEQMSVDDFAQGEAVLPATLAEGEVRVRNRFIALDPYLARQMREWRGVSSEWADGIIHGRIVGEVAESRSGAFAPGDPVLVTARWQAEDVHPAACLEKIRAEIDPPSLRLGVFGASGLTAWVGLALAQPKAGETLLVSAATGPVGSVVGQIAKAQGLHVVGIAGGADKCALAVERYGYTMCLDHREPDLAERLAEVARNGIDIVFENTGGAPLDAALANMADHGRIMLCGLAAHYNSPLPFTFPHFGELLYRHIALTGFATAHHPELMAQGLEELLAMKAAGTLDYTETITDGIENAPAAYLDMLAGKGIGKRLIRC
jgi:NADPH-dependent curcumin reductase CurA